VHTHAAYIIWAGSHEHPHIQQMGRRTFISAYTRSIHTSTLMGGIENAHTHIHMQHTLSTHTVLDA